MNNFDECLIEMVDEAEGEGIDFSEEGLITSFTLDEKPGIIFTIKIESEESFYETHDGRVLN